MKIEKIIQKLESIKRLNFHIADYGYGELCLEREEDESGDFVDFEDLEKIITELKNSTKSYSWRTYTMSELWNLLQNHPETIRFRTETGMITQEPKFPTKRLGKTTTKTSTTDVLSVNKGAKILEEKGFHVRKRLCKESMQKYPKLGKFYKIEIKDYKL